VAGTEELTNMLTADSRWLADIFFSEKIEKKTQVRAVGMDSVLGKPFLGNQVVEKKISKK